MCGVLVTSNISRGTFLSIPVYEVPVPALLIPHLPFQLRHSSIVRSWPSSLVIESRFLVMYVNDSQGPGGPSVLQQQAIACGVIDHILQDHPAQLGDRGRESYA